MRASKMRSTYAGFWVRSAASSIDTALITLITIPLISMVGTTDVVEPAINGSELIKSLSGLNAINGTSQLSGLGDFNALTGLIQLNTGSGGYSVASILIQWILPLVATVLFWVYRSATPGKIALSLSVVDMHTGMPISFTQSIIRYIGYFVSIIPLGLGFLWVVFDSKKQGFHDKIAKTIVIKDIR